MPVSIVDPLEIIQICNQQRRPPSLRMHLNTVLKGTLIQKACHRILLGHIAQVLIHLVDLLLLRENGRVVVAVGQGNGQSHDGCAGEIDQVLSLIHIYMSQYYLTTEGGVPYEELMTGDAQVDYYDPGGHLNTYYAYLKILNEYHTIPVVISEYGVSTRCV